MTTQPSLFRCETPLNADCVLWNRDGSCADLLIVGMYQLEEETATRKGALHVMRFDAATSSLVLQQALDTAATFDLAWLGTSPSILAMAGADGKLHLLSLNQQLAISDMINCGRSAMCLNVFCFNSRVVTGLSDGYCVIFDTSSSQVSHTWKAHDFEAWSAAADPLDHETIWTGADDCILRRWDTRTDLSCATASVRHDAGVTSILPTRNGDPVIITGSYDEKVRVFDTRKLRQPLTSIAVGGGAWRVRYHPSAQQLVVAGMHGGAAVLQMDDAYSLSCTAVFKAHESMCYDVSICNSGTIVASCSFYDRTLHLWNC